MKETCSDCRKVKEVALKFKRVTQGRLVQVTLCKRCTSQRMKATTAAADR